MIAVTVTAEDGETTETYTITVVRPVSTDETVLLDESESEADVQTGTGPKIIASLEALNLNEVRVTWAPSSTDGVTGWEHNYKTQDAQSWEGWADVPLLSLIHI